MFALEKFWLQISPWQWYQRSCSIFEKRNASASWFDRCLITSGVSADIIGFGNLFLYILIFPADPSVSFSALVKEPEGAFYFDVKHSLSSVVAFCCIGNINQFVIAPEKVVLILFTSSMFDWGCLPSWENISVKNPTIVNEVVRTLTLPKQPHCSPLLFCESFG